MGEWEGGRERLNCRGVEESHVIMACAARAAHVFVMACAGQHVFVRVPKFSKEIILI